MKKKVVDKVVALNFKKGLKRFYTAQSFARAALSFLMLISMLSLAHCGSDDSDSYSSNSPSPALSAIYLWVTDCSVKGNMDSGMVSGECGGIGSGVGTARADSVCKGRYSMDAGTPDDRARIMSELQNGATSLQHKALLATNRILPRDFSIRGKSTLMLKRPDGVTIIANSWADFLDPNTTLLMSVVSTDVNYFTGLSRTSGADTFVLATDNCSNWSSAFGDRGSGVAGISSTMDGKWIYNSTLNCDVSQHLLCITY